jgi:pimeloyl-ACP methyl ester carboxylesterase
VHGDPIVFAHANGYPAGTYRLLFDEWRAAGYEVHAIERIGHDPAYPVSNNLPRLRDELAAFVDARLADRRNGTNGAPWLVGHSLGGLLGLMLACRRPELVRGLVMLDSPLFTGWRAHGLKMMKTTGLIRRMSPAKESRRRRQVWPTRAAVLAHFSGKNAFARWDRRVLADYVAAGFDEHDDAVALGFRRETELRIYAALPDQLGALMHKHPPRCPVAYLAGRQSTLLRQAGVDGARQLARERFEWVEGGHLYPMEHPIETAATVLRTIRAMR